MANTFDSGTFDSGTFDDPGGGQTLTQTISDSVVTLDSISPVKSSPIEWTRNVDDSVSVADQLTPNLTSSGVIAFTEALAVSDSVLPVLQKNLAAADSVALSDSIITLRERRPPEKGNTLPTIALECAFGYNPGEASPTFIDLAAVPGPRKGRSFSIERGRNMELDAVETGKASVDLDNRDRSLDPTNASGAYYPNVVPVVPFRIRAGENWVGNPEAATDLSGWTAWMVSGSGLTLVRGGPDPLTPRPTYMNAFGTPYTGSLLLIYPWGTPGPNLKAVTPGESIYISCMVLGNANVSSVAMYLRCLDSGFSYVTELEGSLNVARTGGWQLLEAVVIVPPGTAWAGIEVYYLGNNYTLLSGWLTAVQIARNARQPYVDKPYSLFLGDVEDWPNTWDPSSKDNHSEITVLDAFDPLKDVDIPTSFTRSAEMSGARVSAILDAAGWPAGKRSIDTGVSGLQAENLSGGTRKALDMLQEAARSENGLIFIDGSGNFVFQSRTRRISPPYTTVQATFSNRPDAGELPFSLAALGGGKAFIKNDVTVSVKGGSDYNAQDSASITKYRQRSETIDVNLSSTIEAQALAQSLVDYYRTPHERISWIEITPQGDERLWVHALGREIGDRIAVKAYLPGPGGPISMDCVIERIEHKVELGNWTTRWGLSPGDTSLYWVLGVSALGVDTKLAY